MPDHVHLVATGRAQSSDLRRLVTNWKQATGFAWSQLGRGRLWQPGYWERLARFDEPISEMERYVVENPVRAKLVTNSADYLLAGAIVGNRHEQTEGRHDRGQHDRGQH